MTGRPVAQTLHTGSGIPAEERRQSLVGWLTANGINPDLVAVNSPITVLTVPFRPESDTEPWLVQVIVFTQYHVNPDGTREQNLITREAVTFQRTVPLTVPFPADPATADEGTRDGEEPQVEAVEEDQRPPQHQGGPEADEQQAVRPAETEEVQDRRSSSRKERTGEGGAERIEGDSEEDPRQGHEAVPQPEEVQRQKEVGGP